MNSLYACLVYVFGSEEIAAHGLDKQDDYWFYRLAEWCRPRGMVPALLPWLSDGMFDPTYMKGIIATDGADNWMVFKGGRNDPAGPTPAAFATTDEGLWAIRYMLIFLPMHPTDLLRR